MFHYFHYAFEDWWSEGLHAPYDRVLHDEKFGLPAVHVESDFLVPIRYGDGPVIHLGILRLGKSSVEFGYWMTLPPEDTLLCHARITNVAVDMATFEKQPIPPKWRTAFEAFVIEESEFPGQEPSSPNRQPTPKP